MLKNIIQYKFLKINLNPKKFQCEKLSKIKNISFLEASNSLVNTYLDKITKKENRKLSMFEKDINFISEYKFRIKKFHIKKLQINNRNNLIVMNIFFSDIVEIGPNFASNRELKKIFKIMADIVSLRLGCKILYQYENSSLANTI